MCVWVNINFKGGHKFSNGHMSYKIYQAVLEKMTILLVLIFLVTVAILNSRPD